MTDIKGLIDLSKHGNLTLGQLGESHPEASKLVADNAVAGVTDAVRALFSGGSKDLQEAVAKLSFTTKDLASGSKLGELAMARLRRLQVDDALLGEAQKLIDGAKGTPPPASRVPLRPPPERIDDIVSGEVPIAAQPAMAGLRRLGDAARIGQAVGVGQRALVALTERSVDLVSLDRARIDTLVEDGVLRAREVESVAGAGEIARLLDRQPAMVEAAAEQRVKRTADLLRVPADRWATVAEEQGAAKEVGLDAKEYGELLRARIEAAHPARALAGRITPNRRTLASQVNQLKPLLDGETNVLAKPTLTDKDLDGFDARQRQRLRTAHGELRRVHGRFPGLGIDQVLAEDEPDRAVQRVAELTTVARGFLERNEGVLDMDLSTGSGQLKKLDFRDVTAADRPRVVDFARTYQRLMTIAETPEVTEKVAAAGYRSALAVARSGSDRLRRTTDLTAAQAELVHANAVAVAPAVIGSIGSMLERHRDWFGRLPVGNVPIGVDAVLKEMPGYEDFFGSQDYCACDACRSILGPAAYFVDLMRFVEESISEPTFPEAKRDHPLFLGRRRPDLWTLPLTCENTNDLLPTLQIVAEILETYIANEQGFGGDLGDRAAVADFVYRDTLPTAITSFEQPFVLPIHELRSFLGHYSLDLRDIAETTGRERVRASLGLAREAYVELITRRTGLTRLRELYGVPFQLTGSTIRPFDAQLLLRRTTLSRGELGRAVASRFVTRNGTDAITIRGEKRSSESVQNDVERIRGLTRTALDRLRRMTLLARALDWSFDALDVVLDAISVNELTDSTLSSVVRVDRLRRLFDVSVDEAVALVADIPSRPIVHEGVALVDRLFNPSPYDDAPAWPDASIEILLPAFAPDEPRDPNLDRLQAGLRLDDEGTTQLVQGLAGPLGVDPEAMNGGNPDLDARRFALSPANLARLHRAAFLARALRVSPDVLHRMVASTPEIAGDEVNVFADFDALLAFDAWLDAASRSLDEVERIVGRPIDPALVPDAEGLAALLIAEVAAEEVTSFTAGVFTVLDGVSDATSRALLDADPAAFEAVGERFRTTAGYDPSTPLVLPADDVDAGIVVPTALRADPAPLHEVLDASRPATLIALRAPTLLDARPDAFMAAADLLGIDLGAAAMADALRGDAVATPLVDLLAGVAPLAELFADDALDADRLDFVQANAAGLFALVDPAAPTVDTVRRVDAYAAWAGRLERRDLAPDLDDLLTTFDPATGFAAADPALLASVLDGEPSLATSVHDTVTLAGEAFAALADLEAGVALARRLSVGGVALAQMTSDAYDDVAAASQALQAGLRAKYVDDDEWEEKIEPFRDRVLSRRRDGLAAFLIYSSAPEFDSIEDLYRYFLIDVQLEGCARTSRVVSANSTLQLYVQRVLMNLEETPAGHADPIHAAPDLIDRDEWSWRKNYRVWEANRRVFLFPENYLLPELRDNKTPLFEQLEEALASQDVNSETVRDAYAAYLRGFEEVSRLRIAGAHHEKDDDAKQDVLHLFGVTAEDPPIHYYRRIENLVYGTTEPGRATEWGVWREIDAKISARTVSPIIHQGRLFLFWVEVATNPRQKIEDGSAEFAGYNHKFKLQFATRKLDGSWTAPQTVRMDRDPFHFGDGVVVDEVWGSSVLYSRETHTEAKDGYTLRGFAWDKVYPSHWDRAGNDLVLRGFDYQLNAKLDLYERRMGETLTSGVEDVWVPWVDPASAFFIILFGGRWGFPSSRILWSQLESGDRVLRHGSPGLPFCGNEAFASLVIERERYLDVSRNRSGYDYLMHGPTSPPIDDRWRTPLRDVIEAVFDGPSLITFDGAAPRLSVINGAENHGLIDVEGALFVLLDGLRGDDRYLLRRLNTSLSEDIARTLFTRGVDAMLDIDTQEALAEHPLDFDLTSRVADETRVGEVDYDGPAGVYLREIYFHVPVTIAQHLARQGDYEEARDWFHYVFDPTANEVIADIDPGLSERDRQRRALDRNWRYREFRGREVESLRDVLENESAVETYKNDPFNPHAIARLRLSAYQKWVVLAYVDNLLDWADSLFATDLREQIGEATLLYINALDILGGRPAQLGDCGDKIGEGLSYAQLEAQIADDPDLLLEIETFHIGRRLSRAAGGRRTAVVADAARDRTAVRGLRARGIGLAPQIEGARIADGRMLDAVLSGGRGGGDESADRRVSASLTAKVSRPAHEGDVALARAIRPAEQHSVRGSWGADNALSARRARSTGAAAGSASSALVRRPELMGRLRETRGVRGARGSHGWIASFGFSITRQIRPVFCIPENDQLEKYWDRVEDRLFKIRNCMNIDGVRRPLALFAPPIDPLLLVRARAAGLAIDEVIGAGAGELPPFRFRYLLERARAAASMTQAFGSALASALEKKDAEELVLLRNTHQSNILKLSEGLKKVEIDIAEQGLEQVLARREVITERLEHYQDLISEGSTTAETVRKVAKGVSIALKTGASTVDLVAAIVHLVPQVGAPTAMKYGGKEGGDSASDVSKALKSAGEVADGVAAAAGLVADSERRYQGWAHQVAMAEKELDALIPQETGATLRLDLARKSLALHEQSMLQHDEIVEFFDDKFTGLGHISYLASTLQQLFRAAYQIALGYARLAEVAYRFETDDDSFLIAGGDYWTASRAGLLAGEKLNLDLATLEKRWVEGRRRSMEVNQSFSLAQIDPAALLQLKQGGGCNFTLPEFYFDLFYPGQYQRRIRSVQVTIPCIAGPYVNISATLAMTESFLRSEPDATTPLVAAPRSRDAMIATSTAQADAGVFELNFRDERYLPFEGAGAISSWRLDLPQSFRPFDYASISDVILNISYTAEHDAGLRATVEDASAAVDGALAKVFADTEQTRVFSLRQEFSAAFQRLLAGAVDSEVDLEITAQHFPLYLRGHVPNVVRTTLLLDTADGLLAPAATFHVNTREATGFTVDAAYGGLQAASVANAFGGGLFGSHVLRVTEPDTLAPDGGPGALDRTLVRDILLAVDYTVG